MIKVLRSDTGNDVFVEHTISRRIDGIHTVDVVARCGVIIEHHRRTIGSVDGKRPAPPTHESLQRALDDLRQQVANEASWKNTVAQNITGLV